MKINWTLLLPALGEYHNQMMAKKLVGVTYEDAKNQVLFSMAEIVAKDQQHLIQVLADIFENNTDIQTDWNE